MNREASFTYSGDVAVTEPAAFEAMHARMMQYGDGDLSSAVSAYLMQECGVTQEQIDSIRSILTEN